MSSAPLPSLAETEKLGRGVFSKQHVKKAQQGTIPHRIFLGKSGCKEISVDRLSHSSKDEMVRIGSLSTRPFFGWAVLLVKDANKDNVRRVKATPTTSNPYHADIELLDLGEGEAKDIQTQHAKELADYSQWCPK